MKRMIVMMSMLLVCVVTLFAQEVNAPAEAGGIVINLATFGGITTLVSALVTQLAKVFPPISGSKLAKIGISAGVGIVVCLLGWVLHISDPLAGLTWWQVIIYGLASGLSGCGFYDLIKAIANLFKKDEETKE